MNRSPFRCRFTALVVRPPKSIESNWSRFFAAPFRNGSAMSLNLFPELTSTDLSQQGQLVLGKQPPGQLNRVFTLCCAGSRVSLKPREPRHEIALNCLNPRHPVPRK